MTETALSAQAARRGQMALAVIAIRKAEAHLNAGDHERLISASLDEARARIAKATATEQGERG